MKVSATIISVCLTLFLLCVRCSREEPARPQAPKNKVTRPIQMPAPEKVETSLTGVEEQAKTEVKDAGEVGSAAIEERELRPPETYTEEREAASEEESRYYVAQKGESLSGIAAREDVYGDSLKWPLLYRLNMDKLGKWQAAEDLPDREVPKGLRLKTISPNEIRESLKDIGYDAWAVNVLSGTTNREIIPAAITLMRNGYPVYITRVKFKEKDWMRLRVGFFKNRSDAENAWENIMTILNLTDSWIVKVAKQELEEFGGKRAIP
jgi:hypothetical protein